jgi:hypothetical protein
MLRPVITSAAALFLALGLAAVVPARAQETKGRGTVEGAIIRTFPDADLIELKVENVISSEETSGEKTDEGARAKEGLRLQKGLVIFCSVTDARIFDKSGKELPRETKGKWFSRDKGMAALEEGKRCRLDLAGIHEAPAPKGFPSEARVGGNILVYQTTRVSLSD